MGKKGGKAPALATEPEELKHLGICVNDIIQTPLGVQGTVVGLDVGAGVMPPTHPPTPAVTTFGTTQPSRATVANAAP